MRQIINTILILTLLFTLAVCTIQTEAFSETGDALVIYFSCTGNTKTMAERISELTGAELYEIVPAVPYTTEDLNYSDDSSRTSIETHDEASRPEFIGEIENFEDYDTIYLGYPIWWGTMPKIINTFLDTYDLSGKTVLPFATSGGSGISRSVSAIRIEEPDADVKDGLQLNSSAAGRSDDRISQWLEDNGR